MKKRYKLGLIIIVGYSFFTFGPIGLEMTQNRVDSHSPYVISQEARSLHESLFIGDWHADSAIWKRDLLKESSRGHVDIPRLQKGNVALQMFTTVTKSPVGQNYEKNKAGGFDSITFLAMLQRWPSVTWYDLTERALLQAEKVYQLALRGGENVWLIKSQADLQAFRNARAIEPKLVGALMGTEGSHALEGDLANIKALYDKGFRMMSLQHFFDNKLGGSLHGIGQKGLTEFGQQAVLRMQDLDIIVDVSHSSEAVTADVLAISSKPLVVSHTGFKGHCDTPRNISDRLMKEIADKGGLIAVGFWDAAVCGNKPKDIANAIKYGVALVGANHVALGSDFDGTVTTSIDASEMVAITQALMDVGMSEEDIRKVMGDNMLRFLRDNLPSVLIE